MNLEFYSDGHSKCVKIIKDKIRKKIISIKKSEELTPKVKKAKIKRLKKYYLITKKELDNSNF